MRLLQVLVPSPAAILLAAILQAGLPSGLAGPAAAEERAMNADEIREALAGNTVEGQWRNTPYLSYFQPNGVMLSRSEGGEQETGKWRIDADKSQYCAWLARTGWRCYRLYRDGRTVIWETPGGGERFLSRIIPGRQL